MSVSDKNDEELTASQMTSRLGISSRHLARLVAEGCPTHGTGRGRRFRWKESFIWFREREARLIGGAKASALVAEQIRKLAAQASREELRLARERKEVVEIAGIQEALEVTCRNVRNRFLSLPARLTPLLTGETNRGAIYEILDIAIRDVLQLLSERAADPDLPPESFDSESDLPAM